MKDGGGVGSAGEWELLKYNFIPGKKFDLSVGLLADYCITNTDQWWIALRLRAK